MKRWICMLICLGLLVSMTACGSAAPTSAADIDLDLTQLSDTMVYAEVSSMMYAPEEYIGKMVKMDGSLAVWYDEGRDKHYYTCIISDATACCAQGIEFTWAGDHAPEDYPPAETRVTVVGTFNTYDEDGYEYCQLENADVSW